MFFQRSKSGAACQHRRILVRDTHLVFGKVIVLQKTTPNKTRTSTFEALALHTLGIADTKQSLPQKNTHRNLCFVIVGGEIQAVPDGVDDRSEQIQQVRLRFAPNA